MKLKKKINLKKYWKKYPSQLDLIHYTLNLGNEINIIS
jgi:hypothetical protein